MMTFRVDTELDPLPVGAILSLCTLAGPSCSALGLACTEHQQKLSEHRRKGHKTFIALENHQGKSKKKEKKKPNTNNRVCVLLQLFSECFLSSAGVAGSLSPARPVQWLWRVGQGLTTPLP